MMELSESQLQRDWRNERLIMALRGAGWDHRHRLVTNSPSINSKSKRLIMISFTVYHYLKHKISVGTYRLIITLISEFIL